MFELTSEEYSNLREYSEQKYYPNRTNLARPNSYLDAYKRKEFMNGDLAEKYHENTKLNAEIERMSSNTADQLFQAEMQLLQAKAGGDYPDRELIKLTTDVSIDKSIGQVVTDRRSDRAFCEEALTREELSNILLHGAGVNLRKDIDLEDGRSTEKELRTYPSPGALYPVELYLCILNVEGIPPGVYYYVASEHGLRKIRIGEGEFKQDFVELFLLPDGVPIENVSTMFVLTGAFWRAKAKYGPRGYRYVLQESGHIAQNLLLMTDAIDIGGVPLAAFRDRELNSFIEVDGVNEAVIYTVGVGNTID